MDFFSGLELGFLEQFLIFLVIFLIGSLIFLGRKILLIKKLGKQAKLLNGINDKLEKEGNKQSVITNFIDDLSDGFLIKTIINEWLSLQRSLSNFQKYDFDIHIEAFLNRYRFNHGTFARNLLLIGLLFTFLFLSDSFVELGNSLSTGGNANNYVNQTLIPDVGMALTSTIAAIFVSFLVTAFGSMLENKINALHKELSDFLIIHVHPTFETAAEDTYINKIKSVLEGLTQNIRESNQNLDAISRQSIDTLEKLGEGIAKFTSSTQEFRSLMMDFSEVQDQINEQNKNIKIAVNGLKDSVQAIGTIFEAEGSVIKDVGASMQKQNENMNDLIKVTNGLDNNLSEEMRALKQKFNAEIISTLEENSSRINKSLDSTAKSFSQISDQLENEFSSNESLRSKQINELNTTLNKLTESYTNSLDELNEYTLKREKRFEANSQKIIEQQKELLDQTSKYLKEIKKRVGLFNSIKGIFK